MASGVIGKNDNNEVVQALAFVYNQEDPTKPDNNFGYALCLAIEKLAKKTAGIKDPTAYQMLVKIAAGQLPADGEEQGAAGAGRPEVVEVERAAIATGGCGSAGRLSRLLGAAAPRACADIVHDLFQPLVFRLEVDDPLADDRLEEEVDLVPQGHQRALEGLLLQHGLLLLSLQVLQDVVRGQLAEEQESQRELVLHAGRCSAAASGATRRASCGPFP